MAARLSGAGAFGRLGAAARLGRLRPVVALVVAVLAAAACADGGAALPEPPAPIVSAPPPVADSPIIDATRAELVRVLGDQNLVLQDTQVPFRPAEGPALVAAPRAIFQVVLPDDPDDGFLVVYEFADAARATAAGADHAAYLSSGPGRVQTPIGTRHLIRQVGPALVTYAWNPDGATDERAPRIEEALLTLGTGIEVPR